VPVPLPVPDLHSGTGRGTGENGLHCACKFCTHTARLTPLWPEHGPASSAANYHGRNPEPALGVSQRG